ncbi:hypothetical protein GGX14DRAFT_599992 [Mycena pura]|uniref:Uncharacterized protein n=1 Tax=Mycena pura TaxID=153505 RepID=A0AAD6VNG3_9AGAR|nr:hypothetical protein GGX14DRAFT_599992 [Mycena pura]
MPEFRTPNIDKHASTGGPVRARHKGRRCEPNPQGKYTEHKKEPQDAEMPGKGSIWRRSRQHVSAEDGLDASLGSKREHQFIELVGRRDAATTQVPGTRPTSRSASVEWIVDRRDAATPAPGTRRMSAGPCDNAGARYANSEIGSTVSAAREHGWCARRREKCRGAGRAAANECNGTLHQRVAVVQIEGTIVVEHRARTMSKCARRKTNLRGRNARRGCAKHEEIPARRLPETSGVARHEARDKTREMQRQRERLVFFTESRNTDINLLDTLGLRAQAPDTRRTSKLIDKTLLQRKRQILVKSREMRTTRLLVDGTVKFVSRRDAATTQAPDYRRASRNANVKSVGRRDAATTHVPGAHNRESRSPVAEHECRDYPVLLKAQTLNLSIGEARAPDDRQTSQNANIRFAASALPQWCSAMKNARGGTTHRWLSVGLAKCGCAMRERNPRGGHTERGENREMRVRDARENTARCGCAMRERIPRGGRAEREEEPRGARGAKRFHGAAAAPRRAVSGTVCRDHGRYTQPGGARHETAPRVGHAEREEEPRASSHWRVGMRVSQKPVGAVSAGRVDRALWPRNAISGIANESVISSARRLDTPTERRVWCHGKAVNADVKCDKTRMSSRSHGGDAVNTSVISSARRLGVMRRPFRHHSKGHGKMPDVSGAARPHGSGTNVKADVGRDETRTSSRQHSFRRCGYWRDVHRGAHVSSGIVASHIWGHGGKPRWCHERP